MKWINLRRLLLLSLGLLPVTTFADAPVCSDVLGAGLQGIHSTSVLEDEYGGVTGGTSYNFPQRKGSDPISGVPGNGDIEVGMYTSCNGSVKKTVTVKSGKSKNAEDLTNSSKCREFKVESNGTLKLKERDTQYIQKLNIEEDATVEAYAGDLYIGETLDIKGNITVVGGGTLRIYVNGEFKLQNDSSGVNRNGTADQVVLFVNDVVDLGDGKFVGVVIQDDESNSKYDFKMSNEAEFVGLASVDGDFIMGSEDASFSVDQTGLNADFGGACIANAEPDPEPVPDSECSAVLQAGIQTIGQAGEMDVVNGSARIYNVNGDWRFNFPSIKDYNNNVTHCYAGEPGDGYSSKECLVVDTWQAQEASIDFVSCDGCNDSYRLYSNNSADYTNTQNKFALLEVHSNSNATLGGFDQYFFNNLTLYSNSTLNIPGGSDVYVNNNIAMSGEIVVTGSGTVRLFINGSLYVYANSNGINASGDPEQLAILVSGAVTIDGGTINGSIIQNDGSDGQGQSFTIQNSPEVRGLISVDGTFYHRGGDFIIDQSALNADFGGVCSSEDPIDVSISTTATTALTCAGIEVTVDVLRGSSVDTEYQGTVTLSSSSTNGLWSDADGSLKGTLGTTSNGAVTYEFHEDDNGSITLNYQNPDSGTASLTVTADTADSSIGPIEFSPQGYLITFNKGRTNYLTANEPFTLFLKAVEESETNPLECSPIRNYSGDKELVWTVEYGSLYGEPSARAVNLTANGVDIPEEGDGSAMPFEQTLEFQYGSSRHLTNLNYKDVGPITIHVTEKDPEFPLYGALSGSSTIPVVPKQLSIMDVRDWSSGSCGSENPVGNVSSGEGFVAAGESFGIMTAGLIANCSVPSDVTACTPEPAVETCIAPSFRESVTLSADLETPADGTVGTFDRPFGASANLGTGDFNNGYSLLSDYRYSEVGSFELTANMADFLDTGVSLSDSQVIGRFYPDHFELEAGSASEAACVMGDFSYLGQSTQELDYELKAYNTQGAVTQNYDNQTLGYSKVAATPNYYAYDGVTDLTSRVDLTSSALAWTLGTATVSTEFGIGRGTSVDGPFIATMLGLSLVGEDGETFESVAMTYSCAVAPCTENETLPLLADPLAPLYYGRLVAAHGYSPEGQTLHIPLVIEHWKGSQFVQNEADNCSQFSLDMMSFDPDTNGSDELDIEGGTSTVSMTDDWSSYGRTVTAQDGKFWLSFSSPGTSGAATYFMGLGGSSAPTETWPDWLKYDWDGNGADDESISGVARFGTQRGSDRVISRREL